jgi:antirestriction protein
MSSYRVYVGTYAKYTAGSLKGKWLDLEDYNDKDKFMEACKELHKDEADPEFMFNDHEGVPSQFIGESWIDDKFWDYLNSDIDDDVKRAYMELFGEWNEDQCNDRYDGKFQSDEDYVEDLCERCGLLESIPENLRFYFDFKAYARDMSYNGEFKEENGHYFTNY